jgi:hypothetical protein
VTTQSDILGRVEAYFDASSYGLLNQVGIGWHDNKAGDADRLNWRFD